MNKLETLQLKDFSFSYGSQKVLSEISVSLERGDFICLLGPNGAGKSTLLWSLAESSGIKKAKDKASQISFLSQNETALWDYTVFDTVLSGRYCHTGLLGNFSKEDYRITEEVLKDFGLEELSEKSVHEISGGEFQKVRLARSFVQGSDFLLLDEPLASLDFVASGKFMTLLKEKCSVYKKAVIVSIHDINTAARFADKIILLGKCESQRENPEKQLCFKGTVSEVLTSEKLSAVYKTDVKVFMHPEMAVPQI